MSYQARTKYEKILIGTRDFSSQSYVKRPLPTERFPLLEREIGVRLKHKNPKITVVSKTQKYVDCVKWFIQVREMSYLSLKSLSQLTTTQLRYTSPINQT